MDGELLVPGGDIQTQAEVGESGVLGLHFLKYPRKLLLLVIIFGILVDTQIPEARKCREEADSAARVRAQRNLCDVGHRDRQRCEVPCGGGGPDVAEAVPVVAHLVVVETREKDHRLDDDASVAVVVGRCCGYRSSKACGCAGKRAQDSQCTTT